MASRRAISVSGSLSGFARRLTRQLCFSLDDFRSIETSAATAMMRHALARGVENPLARFRVLRESREDKALDDGEVGASVPIAGPVLPIPASRS